MPIKITAKKDGFRRCGIAHPAAATEYPADKFTPKELKVLQAEPMLVVEITQGDKPTGGDDGKPNKPLKAEELIGKIKEAATVEEVDEILGTDQRATVIAAATARKEELDKGE